MHSSVLYKRSSASAAVVIVDIVVVVVIIVVVIVVIVVIDVTVVIVVIIVVYAYNYMYICVCSFIFIVMCTYMYQLAHHRQLAQICLLSVKPSALMRTPLTRLASSLMAKSQDETQASAEQPASTQASAAQPASTVQIFESLELLRSKQSGKFSTFKVIICYPWKDSYDYLWEA